MSEENDKELEDADDGCHNLAEELLREMPDMKDEIELELNDVLERGNDKHDNTEDNSTVEDAKEKVAEKAQNHEVSVEITNTVKENENAASVEQFIEVNETYRDLATVEQSTEENGEIKEDDDAQIVEQILKENMTYDVPVTVEQSSEEKGEIVSTVIEDENTQNVENIIKENATYEDTAIIIQCIEESSVCVSHENSEIEDAVGAEEVLVDIQEINETQIILNETDNEEELEMISKRFVYDDDTEINLAENDNYETIETNELYKMDIGTSEREEKMDTNEINTIEKSSNEMAEQDSTYCGLKQSEYDEYDSNNKTELLHTRKREKEELTDDTQGQTENSTPNPKLAKLELPPNERKSIIEIHIANHDKVLADEEAQAELERVRKLKEQSIIELNKLKCQEDKLVRLENISKQLQKNIEQSRKTTGASIVEDKNVNNNEVANIEEEQENIEEKRVENDFGENQAVSNIENEEVVSIESKHAEPKARYADNVELTSCTDIDMIAETATAVIATHTESKSCGAVLYNDIETQKIIEMTIDTNAQLKQSLEDTPAATDDVNCEKQPVSNYSGMIQKEVSENVSISVLNSNISNESKPKIPATKTTRTKAPAPVITPNSMTSEASTETASVSARTSTTPATITQTDDNSNHSTVGGEHDNNLLPGELTAEEEERDRELRASRATFLQHLPCFKLQRNKNIHNTSSTGNASDTNDNLTTSNRNIPRCRECRRRNSHGGAEVYCRFYEFRRLQYNEAGDLLVAGFPNPYTDPTPEDIRIWQPDEQSVPTAGWMDIQVARYILLHAGDQFCYLWQQEAEALRLHENPNSVIAWKKIVQGLREICDVCDTTLFNFHWTCDKCGFGVCLDCFKDRKEQRSCHRRRTADKAQRGHDEYHWMLCTATTPIHKNHELRELMLTQIIAGDALNVLGRLLHDIRAMWQVPQMCGCLLSKQKLPVDTELGALIQDMIKESQLKQQTSASSLATEETLRKQARMEELHEKKLEFARARGIDYVPGRVWTKQTLGKDPITTAFDNFKHINFLRKGLAGLRRFLPPRAMTLTYSTMLAPGVPHEWLCDGKFLRLTNAMHPDNRILFQEVWKCGQPVMISEVARSLNLDLWRPEAFCNDFGDKPNDLINCLNGNLVPNQPMRCFWEGFQCIKKRLLDSNGKPMLLKLKDWPPGDDFAEILPTRFADLMTGLPMPEYTLRTGNLNIASCLPKMFVPPDLGPKMYNAYGSALHPDKGTTNLHLDISDAVNIMVYVGVPQDADSKPQLVATQRAIALGGCDYLTRARCQSPDVLPGALWHIFPARDADKIRDLLNRVTIERGFRLEPDHDPIHDQNWYLDDKLRARLFKEYGVEGYPIVQCLGDAVFIPAGAPHQVQNLHNCIKVAEDFVSPENITHCYHLTHEFRHLSHSHTNHEDKLQIKNIIYHSIKDCCHILVRALDQRLDRELAKVTEQNAKTEMSLKEATELVNKLTGEVCSETDE
ncbi:lysine-specific demethylase 3A [Eurosta solidaginis]|uniref:lysine-specific demethylase 3A n=1 Tax=Eurosta solidaginis TaxID=178769 RepID=UPI003531089D